jgi:hypothetical protein
MYSNSCNICCDDYNKSTRSKILCPYCDFEVCRTCCETYILSENIPKCMKPECGKEWSRKFLRENFTNVFLSSKYKEHLEDILFDQEKALLPATQPIVEEKIRKANIRKQIRDLDNRMIELQRQRKDLEHSFFHGAEKATSDKAKFIRQCPANGCRGFLSTQWKCGICEQWTCPDCHELKGFVRDCDHKCDPNNIETAKLLEKDSKPCPKCQSLIFKISGCDQMWCTQCHTAFCWKTGKLENNIHNPHYYEWQRKNGGLQRAAGDIECGRELNHYITDRILDIVKRHNKLCTSELKVQTITTNLYPNSRQGIKRNIYTYHQIIIKLNECIQHMIHNFRVERHNFQTDYVERNQDLRVRYLEKIIDEEEFKMLIQRNDKKNKKNTEITQVIQLANTAFTDIVFRIIDHLEKCGVNEFNLDTFMIEINELRNYCNNIFKDIAFTYSTVQYGFGENMDFIRVEKEKKFRKKKIEEYNTDDNETDQNEIIAYLKG